MTAHGSSNSHTAILARNMNIPAIISVGETFLSEISDGDTAVVNGFTGEFILHPDEQTINNAEKKREEEQEKKALLKKLKGKENITLDGRKINIYANIGSVDNIGAVLLNDAGGIGLFRSEFLYLENTDYPSEDEQFRIYKRVLESMAGKKVIIRTLDIGADKQCDYFHMPKEENPALGIRAIRLCLNRQEVFRTQLRALFRASVFGNLGIMFPMNANVWELEEILALCDEVKAELQKDGIEYAEDTELGIMIETPAALISDQLAPMVDFFSVGTNDLTQYTLACDRQNPAIDRFCDVHHEAILRLIEMAAENAHRHGKWIGICGELAADTSLTEDFLRMGIDELSVSPSFVLKVRDIVRNIDLSEKNRMVHLLLVIIYISFISLGLPDGLLGSAWPSMYENLAVPVSFAGIISMVISGCTILSALFSERLVKKLGTGGVTVISVAMTAIALFGLNGMLATLIFSFFIGGAIGGIILISRLLVALYYIPLTAVRFVAAR